jgi:hypothetical protein
MSPEQAQGETIDYRSDLFSLGSVLYVMCTGELPFRAGNAMAVMKRVCESEPQPIGRLNPEVPEWLCAIVEKLLSKDPGVRFQSAAEVADLLGRHLAHLQQPTSVPMPTPVERRPGPAAVADNDLFAEPSPSPRPFILGGVFALGLALALSANWDSGDLEEHWWEFVPYLAIFGAILVRIDCIRAAKSGTQSMMPVVLAVISLVAIAALTVQHWYIGKLDRNWRLDLASVVGVVVAFVLWQLVRPMPLGTANRNSTLTWRLLMMWFVAAGFTALVVYTDLRFREMKPAFFRRNQVVWIVVYIGIGIFLVSSLLRRIWPRPALRARRIARQEREGNTTRH